MPARYVIDRTAANRDSLGHVDGDSRRLLFHLTGLVNQAIVDQALGRIVVCLGPGRIVEIGIFLFLPILKQRVLRTAWASPTKATPLPPALATSATAQSNPAIVTIHEDGVAADLLDQRVRECTVFCAMEVHGPAAVDRPVAAQ